MCLNKHLQTERSPLCSFPALYAEVQIPKDHRLPTSMYVCMYVCMYIHTYIVSQEIGSNAFIHQCPRKHSYVYKHACIHTYIHTYAYVHVRACMV